jgi:hypothetical protein
MADGTAGRSASDRDDSIEVLAVDACRFSGAGSLRVLLEGPVSAVSFVGKPEDRALIGFSVETSLLEAV